MKVQRAFYLLKHFSNISSLAEERFLLDGYKKTDIRSQLTFLGSKFSSSFCDSPFDLPDLLKESNPTKQFLQQNGRAVKIYAFDRPVGNDTIAHKSFIESSSTGELMQEIRNNYSVQTFICSELPATNTLVLIEDPATNEWVSCFPGKYAPPFPSNGMNPKSFLDAKEFWDNHVFLKLHVEK